MRLTSDKKLDIYLKMTVEPLPACRAQTLVSWVCITRWLAPAFVLAQCGLNKTIINTNCCHKHIDLHSVNTGFSWNSFCHRRCRHSDTGNLPPCRYTGHGRRGPQRRTRRCSPGSCDHWSPCSGSHKYSCQQDPCKHLSVDMGCSHNHHCLSHNACQHNQACKCNYSSRKII